jgi:hypothetical protein
MHFRNVVCGQAVLGPFVLFCLLTGCGQKIEPQPLPAAEAVIRKLGSLYHDFGATQHKKPANMEELKAWAKKLPKTRLADLGIEDVEAIFVSPRDNQPYVLVHGGPAGPWQVVAHEKTGKDGKRYVVTAMGSALEIEDAAFKQNMPSAR